MPKHRTRLTTFKRSFKVKTHLQLVPGVGTARRPNKTGLSIGETNIVPEAKCIFLQIRGKFRGRYLTCFDQKVVEEPGSLLKICESLPTCLYFLHVLHQQEA